MARALAALFALGGVLVLLTLALPRADDASEIGLATPALVALVVAATLFRLADRVGVGVLQALLLLGNVLITLVVLAAGEGAEIYPPLYVLASSYAFFYFRRPAALAEVAVAGVLYAVALLTTSGTGYAAAMWVIVLGSFGVGGILVSRLVAAVRRQAADVTAVSRMPGGSNVSAAWRATCEGVVSALGADVAIALEPAPDGAGLTVAAMAGSAEGGLVFNGERARGALQRAFRTGEPTVMEGDEQPRGLLRARASTVGLAQPVLRDGRAVAVLAVAWTAPRRGLPERTRSVALLFAAEASLALDRAELAAEDRERQALEINDNIVQGLVVAKYSAQRGDVEASIAALDDTLMRARKLISDQLADVVSDRGIRPGDLARAKPAGPEREPAADAAAPARPSRD